PITADPADGAKIAALGGLDASRIEVGHRVISVNGFPVQSIDEFQRVAEATSEFAVGDTVEISLGVENPENGETFVEKLFLPAMQRTTLPNGVVFDTRRAGEGWTTTVTRGFGDTQSELQVGDILVAFMPTNELIDTPEALPNILARELEKGVAQVNFAIKRGEDMWLVAMPYASSQ
ncbi:MAG: hypothetical protein AAFY31_05410, partial [Pseudomonadota bacterium]